MILLEPIKGKKEEKLKHVKVEKFLIFKVYYLKLNAIFQLCSNSSCLV